MRYRHYNVLATLCLTIRWKFYTFTRTWRQVPMCIIMHIHVLTINTCTIMLMLLFLWLCAGWTVGSQRELTLCKTKTIMASTHRSTTTQMMAGMRYSEASVTSSSLAWLSSISSALSSWLGSLPVSSCVSQLRLWKIYTRYMTVVFMRTCHNVTIRASCCVITAAVLDFPGVSCNYDSSVRMSSDQSYIRDLRRTMWSVYVCVCWWNNK